MRKLVLFWLLTTVLFANKFEQQFFYIENCLSNIGNDVIKKDYRAPRFSGNECGIMMFGNGISLIIKNSKYKALDDKIKHFISKRLYSIAKKYNFNRYSIVISNNDDVLMLDEEIEHRNF